MVARPGTYQASINNGELAEEFRGRTDLKQFYGGVAYARNVEPKPQGGGRLSPRSRHMGRLRGQMSQVPVATSFEIGESVSASAVLASITFPLLQQVNAIVVSGFSASQALGLILQFEWQDVDGNWTAFGSVFNLGVTSVLKTRALLPGSSVLAKSVRLRMVSAPPSATLFQIGDLIAFREGGAVATLRIKPFSFDQNQTYQAVIASGFVDFFRNGSYVGCAHTGLSDQQTIEVDVRQRLDTMLLFHQDIQPLRIMRNSSDDDWVLDAVAFTSIPPVDLGAVYVNQDEIWTLRLSWASGIDPASAGIVISVNGQETDAQPLGSDYAATAAQFQALVSNLPGVDPGISVQFLSSAATEAAFRITFSGGRNSGSSFVVSGRCPTTTSVAVNTWRSQKAIRGGEGIMSPSRGYPACTTFYQDRLLAGGFKSKRGAFLASVTADYYNLDTTTATQSAAFIDNLDTEGAEKLHHMAVSTHLMLFTDAGEYFVSDRALDATQPRNIVNSSRNGSSPIVPVVEIDDGAVAYCSKNRSLIYAAKFDYVAQAYQSQPISLIASHIISDVTSIARQKATTATDNVRMWITRGDGTMVVGTMLRGEGVTGYTRWETAGDVLDCCVDGANNPYIAVRRTTGGVNINYLERLDQGLLLDGTLTIANNPASPTVSGLEAHEGATVWAIADGYVDGPHVVKNGTVTLPFAASSIEIGRWTPPSMISLPLTSDVATGIVLKRPKRVHTVRVDLIDTTSIAVGANGRRPRDQPLYRAGAQTDAPLAPVSGELVVTGIPGFTATGQVEITQTKPGRLAWASFTREAQK